MNWTIKQIHELHLIKEEIIINPDKCSNMCPGIKIRNLDDVDCSICKYMFPGINTDIDCPCFAGYTPAELLAGINKVLEPDTLEVPLREDPGYIAGATLLETPRRGDKVVYNCIQPECFGCFSGYFNSPIIVCRECKYRSNCLKTITRKRGWE